MRTRVSRFVFSKWVLPPAVALPFIASFVEPAAVKIVVIGWVTMMIGLSLGYSFGLKDSQDIDERLENERKVAAESARFN